MLLGIVLVIGITTGCQTPGCVTSEHAKEPMISVQGIGVVEAIPDSVSMTIMISELRDTTREAQDVVNEQVADVLQIAREHSIVQEDITTVSLYISPEYTWKDGKKILRGQRVRQSVKISMHDIDTDITRLARFIDGLGGVSGIEISSLNFFVEDTEVLYRQARDLAFNRAKEKAQQFAALSGEELGSLIYITEQSQDQAVRSNYAKGMLMESAAMDYTPSQVPSGSYSVRVTVSAEFSIKK